MYTLFSIIFLLFIGTFIYAGLRGAPWVPTKKKDVQRFLDLANIKPSDIVYDIGCGNGRMVIAAAAKGANAVGFEVSLFPYLLAIINKLIKKSKAKIKYRDLWHVNLGEADLVYFFLMPERIKKLKSKFEQELKPGARVISYVWPIDGWEPIKIDECEGQPKLYLYEI
jgi:SAM-dependent methyltransferase